MSVNDGAGQLGPLEAEVMEAVWSAGEPRSVRAVLDALNRGRRQPLAYTTVMTVMARLAEKEILRRKMDGRGYLYEAAVSDVAGIAVRDVIRDFGESAVASFVEQARSDPRLLKRLERLMQQKR
ncbi:MAG TPA: BlaI/MecI/CopY family transcriptional regulator [Acidimicrobiales bacterium]